MKKVILFSISFFVLPAQAVLYKQNMGNVGSVSGNNAGLLNYNIPQSYQGLIERLKQQQAQNSTILKIKNSMSIANAINASNMLKMQAEEMLGALPANQVRPIQKALQAIKKQMDELNAQQRRAAQGIQAAADTIR